MDIVTILIAVKCAVAVGGAIVLGAAAIRSLLTYSSVRSLAEFVTLGALSLVVLARGAPHNNPALFALFDTYGAAGLIGFAGTMAPAMLGLAWRLRNARFDPAPARLKALVAGLAVLAALSAAEPAARLWNEAQWGDAIFYDRIAVSIARGTMPWGHSYYMPVFQYGSAMLYWAFGHFIFVQQTANVLLALLPVPLLALAAWNFFRTSGAVLLVALLAATIDPLRHAPHLLQIENWYVPVVCFSILATSRYFSRPSLRSAVLVGFAAALIFEIRTQAGFYVGWLAIITLWPRGLPALTRLRHSGIIILIVMVCSVPWMLRNAVVTGYPSPIGTQAGTHIQFSNTGDNFFGIRRDLAAQAPAREPQTTAERIVQMASDPLYVLKAAWWRGLAFYGLLPPGIWDKAGPRSTTWAEMPGYVLRVAPVLALLLASAIGVMTRPGRITFYLLGGIGANAALIFFVGFSEPRLSFPIMAFHIILATAALFPPRVVSATAERQAAQHGFTVPRWFMPVSAGIAALLLASHVLIGRTHLYAAQTDSRLLQIAPVTIDRTLPDLNVLIRNPSTSAQALRSGMRARFTGVLTNAMDPVKWYAFPLADFPNYTADPRREAYFRAYLLDDTGTFQWGVSRALGLTVAGATADRPLREDEGIEVEGEILDVTARGTFWFRADKIRHLEANPGAFETFPAR